MPIIVANIIEGRDEAAKRALIAELTAGAVKALGVAAGQVRVLICEHPKTHWGVAGAPKE